MSDSESGLEPSWSDVVRGGRRKGGGKKGAGGGRDLNLRHIHGSYGLASEEMRRQQQRQQQSWSSGYSQYPKVITKKGGVSPNELLFRQYW